MKRERIKFLPMNDNNKWVQTVDAVAGMATAYEDSLEFGLDLFSIGGGSGGRIVGAAVAEDVSLGNADGNCRQRGGRALGLSIPAT